MKVSEVETELLEVVMAGSLVSVGPILPSGWRWAEFSCGTMAAVKFVAASWTFEEPVQAEMFGSEMADTRMMRWARSGGFGEFSLPNRRQWTVHERLAS